MQLEQERVMDQKEKVSDGCSKKELWIRRRRKKIDRQTHWLGFLGEMLCPQRVIR
jgi:hypothetical protein